jgi:hypothetical protein
MTIVIVGFDGELDDFSTQLLELSVAFEGFDAIVEGNVYQFLVG